MTHKWKRWLAPGAALTAAAVLAACSSASSSGTAAGPGSSAAASSAGSPADAGVAKARQVVSQLEATTDTYSVPSGSVSNVSSLKGKTVYYIPIVQFVPGFVVTASAMKTALAKAGVKLQVCNGGAQPSTIASCIGQATGAGAAGIVLDSIPVGMAANALDAAKAKGIPVLVADQYPAAGTKNTDALAYVPGVVDQPSQIAYWIIASSGGKANAVIAEEADSPSSIQYVVNSEAVYQKYCPACTITVKQITASQESQIQSQAASYINAAPSATYYYTEFEDSLQSTIAAVPLARKSSLSLAVAGGSMNGLGLLSKGSGNLKAVVVVDQAYAGWALTDEILRQATKAPPVNETFPSRLFTTDNIGSIQVTAAAQASGSWFGDNSYQAAFQKLWGV